MEQAADKYFSLEFLEGDMVYSAEGIKAKDLDHAKELVLCFLSNVISEDSELIFHEEITIH
jgi:hypothetical protein|tara:strand:- start:337 stop:519 length:183 start_codon:yes stop_codon:yes gene_type:complete